MPSFRIRLPLSLVLTAAAVLMIAASTLAGRSVATTMVAAQLSESRPDFVAYMLVDVERGITTRHTIDLPDGVDARWWALPPLVLQRHRRFEFADWTLSVLDMNDGTLSPLMVLTTLDNARIRIADVIVRELPGGTLHASVYVPHSGEIWHSSSDSPHAALLATVDRNLTYPLHWSPDGTRLAVKAPEAAGLTVMNADGGDLRRYEAAPATWLMWSPDSSKILLTPSGIMDYNQTVTLVDVERDSARIVDHARFVAWCGEQIVAVHGSESGGSLSWLDPESGAVRELLSGSALGDAAVISTTPLREDSCEWLFLDSRFDSPRRLLHIASGALIEMGADVRFIELTGSAVTYVALTGDNMEVRRLELAPGAIYETLASYPRTFADIHWIDGWRRGLFIDFRALSLLDTRSAEYIALTDPVVQAFSLVE